MQPLAAAHPSLAQLPLTAAEVVAEATRLAAASPPAERQRSVRLLERVADKQR
jgi:hypothetical protein